jgi:hypothetical protein
VLLGTRTPDVAEEALVGGAEASIVLARLVQAHLIRASSEVRLPRLDRIVFPEADGADLPVAGIGLERGIATAAARATRSGSAATPPALPLPVLPEADEPIQHFSHLDLDFPADGVTILAG